MSSAAQKIHLENQIIKVMKTIYDPDMPVNIYDLGLIYEIRVDDSLFASIKMTLTSPNCPVAESLPVEVKKKAAAVDGIRHVDVEVVFDPPWSRDMISESGLLELGLL